MGTHGRDGKGHADIRRWADGGAQLAVAIAPGETLWGIGAASAGVEEDAVIGDREVGVRIIQGGTDAIADFDGVSGEAGRIQFQALGDDLVAAGDVEQGAGLGIVGGFV
jgi:hypothetical protein